MLTAYLYFFFADIFFAALAFTVLHVDMEIWKYKLHALFSYKLWDTTPACFSAFFDLLRSLLYIKRQKWYCLPSYINYCEKMLHFQLCSSHYTAV